jgi:hypothetical protein
MHVTLGSITRGLMYVDVTRLSLYPIRIKFNKIFIKFYVKFYMLSKYMPLLETRSDLWLVLLFHGGSGLL